MEHRGFPESTLLRKSVKLLNAGLQFVTNFAGWVALSRRFFSAPAKEIFEMRPFIAACVAIGVLWVIDVEFNNGRYTGVVKSVMKSALQR